MKQKLITEEIQELRAMAVPELVDRFEAVHGKLPRTKNRTWLWRKLAWEVQSRRYGGLSQVAKRRLDELIAELDVPLNGVRTVREMMPSRNSGPVAGTTLTRTWRGQEIQATRVESGWECEGIVHGSLSAVARAVTGAHWNGKLFFGLTKRKAAR